MEKVKIFLLIALLGGMGYVIWQNNKRGEEIQRLRSNDNNLVRQLQDYQSDLISYEFENTAQLEQFLKDHASITESNLKNVYSKLDAQGIKLNRIDRIVQTEINTTDSTFNKIVLDSLGKVFEWLKQAENGAVEIPFEDKTECFEFKARLVFDNGETSVQVIERQYNDTLMHVSSWERNKWSFLGLWEWRLFGRKIARIEIFNNCGLSKVFVIDSKKNRRKIKN